jgi:hypothetical protein
LQVRDVLLNRAVSIHAIEVSGVDATLEEATKLELADAIRCEVPDEESSPDLCDSSAVCLCI